MAFLRFLKPSFLFHHYSRLLEEVPIPTKILSCTVIMGTADTLQQYLEFRATQQTSFWQQHHSIPRLMRMIAFMALFHVPYLHYFHAFLDHRILRLGIKHPTLAVVTKVTLDQGIAAPPYMIWFLFMTNLMEGKSLRDINTAVQTNWKPMLYNCWKIWIPGHCVTYSLPFKYRSVWCDCVRVYWGTLMSYYANKNDQEELDAK